MADCPLRRSREDPQAFGDFYRAYATAITRYFARQVLDGEAALDLTAETFAQAYAGRRRFRGQTDEEARAWLYTIAQRQLSLYLRRGYASRAAMQRLGLERPVAEADELLRLEQLGATHELRAMVAREMAELPEGPREALRLRVVEDLAYSEIARQLAITETAARMRVSRALAELRTVLTSELPHEGIA